MGRYTGSLGRPIQGISQQPSKTRIDGQCTDSVNFRPDVVKGLRTRVGSDYLSTLTKVIGENDKIIHYRRDEVEEYFIIVPQSKATGLWVFDKHGVEHTVTVQDQTALDYIYNAQATYDVRKNVISSTIADTTIIANTEKVVANSTSTSPAHMHEGVVYCQFMDYGQKQQIIIDGVVAAEYTSPDGDDPTHKAQVATSFVAQYLFDRLTGVPIPPATTPVTTLYDATLHGNTIFVKLKTGVDFQLSTSDDADGGNLIAVKESVTDVSKLPPKAPVGLVVKILPKNGKALEEYWLKATDGGNLPTVVWKESLAPSTVLGLDNTTMPVQLVRETYSAGQATFKLSHVTYNNREVGNVDINSDPDFVDNTVTALGLFQNRLMIASGENVSMSRSSDFFNFYRTTTQSVVDTDPIGLYSDSNMIVRLRDAISYNGDMYFFTDVAQLSLSGAEIVTPSKLVPLRFASSFEVQPSGHPVAAGENIFFPFDYGQFSGIREYFTDSITDTKRARPITDHVNQLIKGKIRHMATSTSLNVLAVQGTTEQNVLFIYDWMWQGNEKVQSAWGRWVFPEQAVIRHFEFSEANLIVVYELYGKSLVLKFDLGEHPDNVDVEGRDINFSIDHKSFATATRVSGDFAWTVPAIPALEGLPESSIVMILASGHAADIGTTIDFVRQADGSFLIPDADLADSNVNTVQVLTGHFIDAKYTPSNPYPRDADGTSRSGLDRLQIGRLFVNYDMSGVCLSVVKDTLGREKTQDLYPRIVGNGLNLVGFSPITDGVFRIPVRSKSDRYEFTIKTSSHIPLQIREIEYDCNYHRRGGVL